jgi:hypothetical protein
MCAARFDLAGELLSEHSKVQAARLAQWAARDPRHFAEVVQIFSGGDPLLTQRSSWIIGLCAESVPGYFPRHLRRLLDTIERPGIHPSGPRNVFRALMRVPLPAALNGRVVDLCIRFLGAQSSTIAVRCEAMYVLARLSGDYPDLRQELILLVTPWEGHESPGIRCAVRKILGRPSRSRAV